VPTDPDERKTYAMRLIAQRCLYGVDKNPLAAEMAKLSLWLLTVAKDKPFEFLDHSIRCGDSLVGLSSIEQLKAFSLRPEKEDDVKFFGSWLNGVDEAIALRLKLEEMPANTVEDVARQEKLLREASDKMARLRCAADLLVAAEFWGTTPKDRQERVRHAAVVSGHYVEHGPTAEFQAAAEKARRGTGTEKREPGIGDRDPGDSSFAPRSPDPAPRYFHWPLEFPEVIVKRGGFDAFVGNPPFMGGRKIRGALGGTYLAYLTEGLFAGSSGNADLCAFFFLRAAGICRSHGGFGLLATNTIAQGDTRSTGLERIETEGFTIYRANPSQPWPGVASLEVAIVWVHRGYWGTNRVLADEAVEGITSFLAVAEGISGTPYRLKANEGKSFQGSVVLGMGFVVSPEEAQALIAKDPRNKDVLFPYLNGEDLNSRPDQSPSRWVINFFDWPLEKAMEYPDCFRIVEEKVRPERKSKAKDVEAAPWWQFWRQRPELYRIIAGMDRVWAGVRHTKYWSVSSYAPPLVYSDALIVFAVSEPDLQTVLCSSFHDNWARDYSGSLETRMRYTPSDCFETFPFPRSHSSLEASGKHYEEHRRSIMSMKQEGLTPTYNRFHNPSETSADIQKLRDLHVEMDQAVAAAYGWDDLDLGHGFHQTKQGLRFTISEPARREVLQRLLKLNHERYAEEVAAGLHEKKKGTGSGKREPRTGKHEAVSGKRGAGSGKTKTGRDAPSAPRTSDPGPRTSSPSLFDDEEG
jgi:hypothetical protein